MGKTEYKEKKAESLELSVDNSEFGEVKISSEVIATIAVHAAMEVDGVVGTVGGIKNDLISRLGVKNEGKGVRVVFVNDKLEITILVNVAYGKKIPEISKETQTKIKEKIEYMTGLEVNKVNVRVAGVTYTDSVSE
ncbi:MAG: Asp23/Gls24 family envelope stress response protein [Lachnospiraceae bacterium]|nr:Asp23/Gls24 family envelope stress response protein [Lachnospiraceae bacterium]